MIKVTFKEPQTLVCYETITHVVLKLWLGWKTYNANDKTVLFSQCGKYFQSVCSENIKSIEQVKPTEL